MNAIVMTGGASCSLTAYAPDTPCAERMATRRARCSGLAPALSRLRGTYALTRSDGGLAPAESVPEDVAAHCFRSTGVPLRVVRLVHESHVAGNATDAAPCRAGPRRIRRAVMRAGRGALEGAMLALTGMGGLGRMNKL